MKTYVKPAMMALSISANDQLCGGCDIGTRGNLHYKDLDDKFGDGDGTLTEQEAKNHGLFGTLEDCDMGVENYCKFTANDNRALFTS